MLSISSIQQINYVSSINTVNLGGVAFDFTPTNMITLNSMSLLSFSSIMSYDLSGNPTYYTIDISGVENLSTVKSLEAQAEVSTLQGLSTIEGVSTMQGLSTLASYEVSIYEIINSHNTLLETETQNKSIFNSLDFTLFKTNLYKWAAQGYPDSFHAYSFPVNTPTLQDGLYLCSDGNPKSIWDYIPFCMNMSISDWLSTYQSRVNGITLSFSVNANPYVLNIHVTKTMRSS